MSDLHSDEACAARRERFLEIAPEAASACMSESAFNETYRGAWITDMDRLAKMENLRSCMFCPACSEITGPGSMGRVYRLHVSYEPDPLGNVGVIATTHCFHCGWEEVIPVIPPKLTPEESDELAKKGLDEMRANMINNQMGQLNAAAQGVPGLWSQSIVEKYKQGLMGMVGMPNVPGAQRLDTSTDRATGTYGQDHADRVFSEVRACREDRARLEMARARHHYTAETATSIAKRADDAMQQMMYRKAAELEEEMMRRAVNPGLIEKAKQAILKKLAP